MSRNPHTILMRPVLSEKSLARSMENRRVVFEIARDANKIEVARAVESVFGVKVEKVNTVWVRGKDKRMGRFQGRRPDCKRAVVTLKQGQTLNLFES
ncbi:MAG: 50S ribosomal protein L23 [Nitrospirota bacterium]|nr:50S ribosomal protein L23 [Nitrospirota bacterium]